MAVNPNNTNLRCKFDNYTCTMDPNDTMYFEVMVVALRTAGAIGTVLVFRLEFAQRNVISSPTGLKL
jgi:hypothetical protein